MDGGGRHELRGDELAVEVVDLGANVASIVHRASGAELLFRAEWADDPFDGFARMSDSSREWHRRYGGGWHPLVPHAGDAVEVDGVEHPFHGEAGWRRWSVGTSSPASVTHDLRLRTVPFRLHRTVTVDGPVVRVEQRIVNVSDEAHRFTWAEHPTFGEALLGPSSRLTVGGRDVGVRLPAAGERHGAFTEVDDDRSGTVRLLNPDRGLGVELRFDAERFPVLWLWQEHRHTRGFPWWGTANTIGIEPSSRRYHERGVGLGPTELAPGAAVESTLELEVLQIF